MADQAIIEEVTRPSANVLQVRGVFTDGATFKTPFDVPVRARTREDVRIALAGTLADSRAGVDVSKLITPGVFDLAPPEVDPPSDGELAKQAWLAAAERLATLRRYLSADHADLVSAQQTVDSGFKAEYVE